MATLPLPPFALDRSEAAQVRFLAGSEMSAADRALAASAQAEIDRQARRASIDRSRGSWTANQIDCPALPDHLFLRYQRAGWMGVRTIFSAAILRASGRVELIPLVANNHSGFWPAPVVQANIAAFNRIRNQEPAPQESDWLGTGLCYAALAGAQPRTAAGEEPYPAPALELGSRDRAVVRFTDMAAFPQPLEWSLSFDHRGKLLKVTRQPALSSQEKLTHPAPVDERGKEVHPAPAPVKGR